MPGFSDSPRSNRLLRTIITVLIIVGTVAAINLGSAFALGTSTPFFVVESGSMVPALNVGDMIIVRAIPFSEIGLGDMIVFFKPQIYQQCRSSPEIKGCVIVHRVINTETIRGEKVVTTKGDANFNSIPGTDTPITRENYIGKVVVAIPYIGHASSLTSWLRPPASYIVIGIVIMLLFVSEFFSASKKTR